MRKVVHRREQVHLGWGGLSSSDLGDGRRARAEAERGGRDARRLEEHARPKRRDAARLVRDLGLRVEQPVGLARAERLRDRRHPVGRPRHGERQQRKGWPARAARHAVGHAHAPAHADADGSMLALAITALALLGIGGFFAMRRGS